ncbi:MAG: glycerophosphoryl diester phosphodiesterase membrane domain-containing protein [Terracidiphilus sp.]
METTLRPLTLGEILDRTAELYRSNFLLLAGISSIYAGILLVLSLVQIGAQQGARALHMDTGLIVVSVIGLVVLGLVVFVAGGLAIAANTRAVGWLHLGESASIGAAYRAILPRTGRYLWLMTITYFRAWFPCVVIYAAYTALLLAYIHPKGLFAPHAPPPNPKMLIIFLASTAAFLFLLLGFLVYGILMSLRYALAIPACTVENLKARQAIRRSIQLSKGSRGRIFMLGLLALIIQLGLYGLTQGFFIMVGIKNKGVIPVWMSVLQQFLAFLTNTFVQPIYATGFTLFYFDQRVRKEGYDIEHMMQSVGMTQPPPMIEAHAAAEAAPSLDRGSGHE